MKFDFTENGIDYADGTGTYEKGYYAAAPSSIVGDGYNKETDEVFFHDSQADYYVTADEDFCYASAR